MSQNANEKMPKIDMSKEFQKMSSADQYYVRKLEAIAAKRAGTSQIVRNRNKFTAAILGAGVLGICKSAKNNLS